MIRDLHDIDKLFKDALEGNPEPVPPAAWEALNNDLDKMQASHFREKYFRVKRLALLLLLVVFSGSLYMFYYISSGKKDIAVAKKQTSVQDNTAKNTAATKTETADNGVAISSKKENSTTLNNSLDKQPLLNNKQANAVSATATNTTNTNQPEALSDKSSLNKAVPQKNDGSNKETATQNNSNQHDITSAAKKTKPISLQADNSDITVTEHPENITKEDAAFREKNTAATLHIKKVKQPAVYDGSKPVKEITAAGKNKPSSKQETEWLTETGNKNIAAKNGLTATQNNYEQTAYNRSSSLADYSDQPASILAFNPVAAPPFTSFHSLLLSDSVQAENQKTANVYLKQKAPLQHRFSLTAFVAPNNSFTRLKNDQRLAGPAYDKNEAKRSEQQARSYSAGLLVNYSLGRNLILQSGLVYSSAKTNIAPKTIYAKPDNNGHTQYEFNCSMGNSYLLPHNGTAPAIGDSIKISGSSSTITYIGVPLSLQYVIRKGKFSFKPGIGFSVNFLTNGQSSSILTSGSSKLQETATINGLKKTYTDGIVGVGVEYKLNRRFSVGVKPLLRWAFTPVNKNTPVSMYQNYLSLETGLKINL